MSEEWMVYVAVGISIGMALAHLIDTIFDKRR